MVRGTCRDNKGLLICERCDRSGSVRKYKCPFGWCRPTAYCPSCAIISKVRTRAAHRAAGCEVAEKNYARIAAKREKIMQSGKSVRCSALSTGNGRVHVLFDDWSGVTTGLYMSDETYRAIPLGQPSTPEDYRAVGLVEEAPVEFVR